MNPAMQPDALFLFIEYLQGFVYSVTRASDLEPKLKTAEDARPPSAIRDRDTSPGLQLTIK